jgi:hypothetical protein
MSPLTLESECTECGARMAIVDTDDGLRSVCTNPECPTNSDDDDD